MKSALTMPATGIDPDWRERIDLAKRAYAEGKKLREGKPITFRMSQPLNLGDSPQCLRPNRKPITRRGTIAKT